MNKNPQVKPTPQNSAGLTFWELSKFYLEFFDKCDEIIFNNNYPAETKKYATGILEFLNDHKHITWKQFTSIICVHEHFKNYNKYVHNGTYCRTLLCGDTIVKRKDIVIISPTKNFTIPATDKSMDSLYQKVYGERPKFWQCEKGLEVAYDSGGNRVFLHMINSRKV